MSLTVIMDSFRLDGSQQLLEQLRGDRRVIFICADAETPHWTALFKKYVLPAPTFIQCFKTDIDGELPLTDITPVTWVDSSRNVDLSASGVMQAIEAYQADECLIAIDSLAPFYYMSEEYPIRSVLDFLITLKSRGYSVVTRFPKDIDSGLGIIEELVDKWVEVRPLETGWSLELPGHYFVRERTEGILTETESGVYKRR